MMFTKDDLVIFVSAKTSDHKRFSRIITDPVCTLKVLKTLPHYDENRYMAKLNGEWHSMLELEDQEMTEHMLRNIEAFKFVPTNEIIWNRGERNLDFIPY